MAFSKSLSGDRLGMSFAAPSVLPKTYGASYVAAWAAALTPAQTVPLVGDLVKQDTSLNDGVKQCVAGDVPYGMVYSVNSSNGTLSVVKVSRASQIIFEYNGAFSIGDNIVADGSRGTLAIDGVLRDRVKRDNTNGIGMVFAKDSPKTGLAVVEFPSGARGV